MQRPEEILSPGRCAFFAAFECRKATFNPL